MSGFNFLCVHLLLPLFTCSFQSHTCLLWFYIAEFNGGRFFVLSLTIEICRCFQVGSIEGRVAVQHIDEAQHPKNFTFKCHRDNNDIYAVNAINFHPVSIAQLNRQEMTDAVDQILYIKLSGNFHLLVPHPQLLLHVAGACNLCYIWFRWSLQLLGQGQ